MRDVAVHLPELHPGQVAVRRGAKRFNVMMCGRRWGKTTLGIDLVTETAIDEGMPAAWLAPTYKFQVDAYRTLTRMLAPIITKQNAQEMRIELLTGGLIDFWTMESGDPGRGRAYRRVVFDEAGLSRNLIECWEEAVRPTLVDHRGDAWFLGTPKGRGQFHRLFLRGRNGDDGWAAFSGSMDDNPYIPRAEIAEARASLPPEVAAQELDGIPAENAGNPFGLGNIARCIADGLSHLPPFVWGVDLARSVDWTVAIALDEHGRVCRFERWQGVPWAETRRRLVELIGTRPALIDATGVGDPIVEDVAAKCPRVDPLVFTASSKQTLMAGLVGAVQSVEVRFPEGPIRDEMEVFEYDQRGGRWYYSAPDGYHDDCVVALALAVQKRRDLASGFAGVSVASYAGVSESGGDDDDRGWTRWH